MMVRPISTPPIYNPYSTKLVSFQISDPVKNLKNLSRAPLILVGT